MDVNWTGPRAAFVRAGAGWFRGTCNLHSGGGDVHISFTARIIEKHDCTLGVSVIQSSLAWLSR